MIFNDCTFAGNIVMDFFTCIISGLQTSAGSVWGIGITLLIAIISFMTLKDYTFDRALVTSGFITMIAGLFMLKLEWISVKIFLLILIYFIVGVYFVIKERGGEEA